MILLNHTNQRHLSNYGGKSITQELPTDSENDRFWGRYTGNITKIARSFLFLLKQVEDRSCQDKPGFCKSDSLEWLSRHDSVLTSGLYMGTALFVNDRVSFKERIKNISRTLYIQIKESAELDEVIWQNLGVVGYGQ